MTAEADGPSATVGRTRTGATDATRTVESRLQLRPWPTRSSPVPCEPNLRESIRETAVPATIIVGAQWGD
ncbi:MAG TPA: hypothetical protein VGA69_03620, partial [Nitriliruptorales bacterium]